jgi:uncharacterized membrane protein YfcA
VADLLSIYPLTVWVALLTTGIVIGLLAGLMGVGGGIIAVPVLLEVFAALGVPSDVIVPLAVGTAQASIVIAALVAAFAHWRAGTIDRRLVKAWLPALVVGTVLGLGLGPFAPAKLLIALFAAIAAGLGITMALGDRVVLTRQPLKGPAAQLLPALVGALAAALGVGGGTLSTPVLSLFSFPIRRAVGAGALFNLIISLPATLAFLAMDWQTPGRPPDAVGDVAAFCVAALSLPALFVAPMAARWSSRVPVVLLRQAFALCLCAIAVRILLRP